MIDDSQSTINNQQSSITRVLVVEDSPVIRDFLVHILSGPDIRVIGTASNGAEAVEFAKRNKPDVVTMDLYMPVMNGLEATRKIMESTPVPIVIVSGLWDPKEVETTFRALEAGALAIVQRPNGIGHPRHESSVKELVRTVKLMSEVKVVRRWSQEKMKPPDSIDNHQSSITRVQSPIINGQSSIARGVEIVAIGASSGGPPALRTILNGISKEFPAPLLVVQHIAPGFLPGMLNWLQEDSTLCLEIGSDGAPVLPGHAYFAPDGCHMGIGRDGRISLSRGEREHGARPAVSYLFRSVAQACGGNAVGILLTGMGNDGAREMKLLREKGAVTIAQSRESSAVYGMPAAAVELDAAVYVLSPEQIPAVLAELVKKSVKGGERNARK